MRLFSAALCVALFACAPSPQGASDAALDRNPALRTTAFGDTYNLFSHGWTEAVATTDHWAFVAVHDDEGCVRVGAHAVEDAEARIREARQEITDCSRGQDERVLVDAAGDLLVIGTDVYGLVEGQWWLEVDLADVLPPTTPVLGMAVTDENEVVIATRDTVYELRRTDTWTVASETLLTTTFRGGQVLRDGHLLALGNRLFLQTEQGWEEQPALERDAEVLDVRGGRIATRHGTTIEVDSVDADGRWSAAYRVEASRDTALRLLENGGALEVGPTLKVGVWDAVGRPVARDSASRSVTFSRTLSVAVAGSRALLARGDKVEWIWLEGMEEAGPLLAEEVAVERDASERFSFEVAPGTRTLTVRITGTGDADLYVRRGEQATVRAYDCAPYRWGSDEVCTFTDPTPGTWHTSVVGYDAFSEVVLTASVE